MYSVRGEAARDIKGYRMSTTVNFISGINARHLIFQGRSVGDNLLIQVQSFSY